MELIRNLGTRINKKGRKQSWGLFKCPDSYCGKEVERQLGNGIRNISCGCQKYTLISNKLKGKKRTEVSRKKQGETIKDHIVTKETRLKISKSLNGHGVTKKIRLKISKTNLGKNRGILNGNWNNGSSFEIYPQEFFTIRKFILERDNYTCQDPNCEHKTDILDCHHIDYDKKNNNSENLITLCHSCHAKTIGINKRIYYIEFYQNMMMGKILECLL